MLCGILSNARIVRVFMKKVNAHLPKKQRDRKGVDDGNMGNSFFQLTIRFLVLSSYVSSTIFLNQYD